jgi:hypothetical protein
MISVRLRYNATWLYVILRECSVSDDSEYPKFSKLARLSFITHLRKKSENFPESDDVINAKYPVEDVASEYSILYFD